MQLQEFNQFGIIEKNNVPLTTSRKVAENFNKNHDDVLKSIRSLIEGLGEISESEWKNNFIESKYKNQQGKNQPEYLMTKKGFTLLAVGFSGKKALQFKVKYIDCFEHMESFIRNMLEAKADFPEFTSAILAAHEEPKHYHFSNEINMINQIVTGMTAKQFREHNNLGNVSSIRPYLTPQQLEAVKALQRIDIGLIVAVSDYQQRKAMLEQQYKRLVIKSLAS